ncbi:MAG: hypothetical protein E6Q78_14715 [Rhodoferax sp.]|nr:MAG: hypothetical protein E6Q78_14715 [Rhodoferax sp.]
MRGLIYLLGVALALGVGAAQATAPKPKPKTQVKRKTVQGPKANAHKKITDGVAEARLIELYRLVGAAQTSEALRKAEKLVADFPHFQLAQMVYGDLLSARYRPLVAVGDIPADLAASAPQNAKALQAESALRLAALTERPPQGVVPIQFVGLSAKNKHAIVVDTQRARLYLLENSSQGLRLLADYYISVGKAGVGKSVEGDQRTPLGVYFITSNLDPTSLKDLYGSGALPVNYPNVLDLRRGKTGGGIWLHGTPSTQFTRAPQATDGCVAVANPDLERIIQTVEIRTTPVLISKSIQWVKPETLTSQRQQLTQHLQSWANSKSSGRSQEVLSYYAADFGTDGTGFPQFSDTLRSSLPRYQGRAVDLQNVSIFRWTDETDIFIATFDEIIRGEKSGQTIRQYWQRQSGRWKIIFESRMS